MPGPAHVPEAGGSSGFLPRGAAPAANRYRNPPKDNLAQNPRTRAARTHRVGNALSRTLRQLRPELPAESSSSQDRTELSPSPLLSPAETPSDRRLCHNALPGRPGTGLWSSPRTVAADFCADSQKHLPCRARDETSPPKGASPPKQNAGALTSRPQLAPPIGLSPRGWCPHGALACPRSPSSRPGSISCKPAPAQGALEGSVHPYSYSSPSDRASLAPCPPPIPPPRCVSVRR